MAKEKSIGKSARSLNGSTKAHGSKSSNLSLKKVQAATVTKKALPSSKPQRSSTDNVFGHHLPSPRLRLPSTGNVTAAEQIILLTETVRSHDPLNRLVQNHFDVATLAFMINRSRMFPKYPLKANSLRKTLQGTMRVWGHKAWTFGKHQSSK
jgi:hypothetical protein